MLCCVETFKNLGFPVWVKTERSGEKKGISTLSAETKDSSLYPSIPDPPKQCFWNESGKGSCITKSAYRPFHCSVSVGWIGQPYIYTNILTVHYDCDSCCFVGEQAHIGSIVRCTYWTELQSRTIWSTVGDSCSALPDSRTNPSKPASCTTPTMSAGDPQLFPFGSSKDALTCPWRLDYQAPCEGEKNTFNNAKDALQSVSDTAYLQSYTQSLQTPPATATEDTFLQIRYLS